MQYRLAAAWYNVIHAMLAYTHGHACFSFNIMVSNKAELSTFYTELYLLTIMHAEA